VKETFDVAIVGAGPAGISAAYILAGAGKKVIVLERGEHPGSKNVSGGVLYGHDLAQVIPDYIDKGCPVERNIIESRIWYLSKDGGFSLGYRDRIFGKERQYNAFTVSRAKFDRWYAEQAQSKGALVVPSTVVTGLLRDKNGTVTGVMTQRDDGEVRAKVTLLADGINSPLAASTGFRPEPKPEQVALAVKEVISLPAETIQERFGVSGSQGVTTEILGEVTGGMDGVAFLYTNRSSLSIGIGANLADFGAFKLKPYELIENLKQHPMVAPLIEGGRSMEYIAHWLAEGGYDTIPKLYGDGYLIAGDSAMLFNTLHREGNNLAMASGKMAAEAILETFKLNDFSDNSLKVYGDKLADSFVMKDLKKYRRFTSFLYNHKELFMELPEMASFGAREIITVNSVSKKEKERSILAKIRKQMSIPKIVRFIWQVWRATR
jgi:electron transfer flavoprotein-quinone oxidoreductase